MSATEENILVVPRSVFEKLGAFEGVIFDVEKWLPELLSPANNQFLQRSLAEPDPGFKQIIPYSVLTFEGRVLRYFRGKASGEARLHAKASIGIGGHINDEDSKGGHMDEAAYRRAVDRELQEELHCMGTFDERIVGLLNDESNEVGQVHLGVIHHCRLHADAVTAGESALQGLEWIDMEQLQSEFDRLETWSQLVVRHWQQLFPSW
jgi:predicted NUDIX family phosphoesterase